MIRRPLLFVATMITILVFPAGAFLAGSANFSVVKVGSAKIKLFQPDGWIDVANSRNRLVEHDKKTILKAFILLGMYYPKDSLVTTADGIEIYNDEKHIVVATMKKFANSNISIAKFKETTMEIRKRGITISESKRQDILKLIDNIVKTSLKGQTANTVETEKIVDLGIHHENDENVGYATLTVAAMKDHKGSPIGKLCTLSCGHIILIKGKGIYVTYNTDYRTKEDYERAKAIVKEYSGTLLELNRSD